MRKTANRRTFLKRLAGGAAAATAGPYVLTSHALGAAGVPAASERIAMGFIGCGGHGVGHNLNSFLTNADCQVVALCDVHVPQMNNALKRARGKYGQDFTCFQTQDWREVISRADVDAVMISTPDHWHVPISIAAIRAGKDVLCEKPTLTVREGRMLVETAQRYAAVFGTSTEDRSLGVYLRIAELCRNGRLGKLQRIYVKLPAGPNNPADPTPQPVPADLDWDMWLGPAPYAPYCAARMHWNFRWIRDYSGGQLTDWGAHCIDTAQWASDTESTGPVSVEGTGKRHDKGLYDTYYEYHIKYTYADGLELLVDSGGVGVRVEGSDGWVDSQGWIGPLQASSRELLTAPFGPGDTRLYTCPRGEHRNFLDCVKSRRTPYFSAEAGHRCSSVSHIGNIAMDLGRKLRWDPKKEVFPDDEQANRMLSRTMRSPWTL